MTALVSPSMLATERSISPVMTTRVSAVAISAIGTTSRSRNVTVIVLAKLSTHSSEPIKVTTRMTSSTNSHDPTTPRSVDKRVESRRSATSDDMGPPALHPSSQADREEPVEADRREDQRADEGLLPERVDAEHRQRAVDRREEQSAEGRSVDRAAAAEDRDPADDRGGDDLEFESGTDRGVESAVTRGVQHSGETGQRTVDGEHAEDPTPAGDAGEPGRVGVGSDGVELAAAAIGPHVERRDRDHDQGDPGQPRNAEDAGAPAEVEEAGRHVGGVDLLAGCPQVVDRAIDVEGAERDDQRGHLGQRHQRAVERTEERPREHADEDRNDDRCTRILQEQLAGAERDQPDQRAH